MNRESKIWEANKTSKDEKDDIGVKRRKTKLWNIYTFFYINKVQKGKPLKKKEGSKKKT